MRNPSNNHVTVARQWRINNQITQMTANELWRQHHQGATTLWISIPAIEIITILFWSVIDLLIN